MSLARRRRRGASLLPALLVLVGLGFLFLRAATLKAPEVAQELEQRCRRAVQVVDPGLWVRMDGRDVELEGRADSVEQVERAWRRLEEVDGVRHVKRSEARLFLRRRADPDAAPAMDPASLADWAQQAAVVPEEDGRRRVARRASDRRAKKGPRGRAGLRRARSTAPAATLGVTLPTLTFPPESVTLGPGARRQLDRAAGRILDRPGLVVGVTVEGGGDGRDTARARAVRAALVARGVSPARVQLGAATGLPTLDPPEGAPAVARAHLTVLRSAP